jgi:glycosyl transferase family 25
LKVFVINLERSTARRESIKKQLDEAGVEFEFIKAVDGSSLTDEYLQKALNFEEIAKRPYLMRKGAYGCALSHYAIYLKMIAENIPHAVILEDDVLINKEFKNIISGLTDRLLPNEVILLFTQNNFMPIVFSSLDTEPIYNKYKSVYPIEPWALGSAAGYIITNEAARGLAHYVFPVREPADAWIAFYKDKAIKNLRCVVPFPVRPAGFESNIDYLSNQSLLGKLFTFSKKYNVFPIKQLLDYRRQRMLVKSSAYSFTSERSPLAIAQTNVQTAATSSTNSL